MAIGMPSVQWDPSGDPPEHELVVEAADAFRARWVSRRSRRARRRSRRFAAGGLPRPSSPPPLGAKPHRCAHVGEPPLHGHRAAPAALRRPPRVRESSRHAHRLADPRRSPALRVRRRDRPPRCTRATPACRRQRALRRPDARWRGTPVCGDRVHATGRRGGRGDRYDAGLAGIPAEIPADATGRRVRQPGAPAGSVLLTDYRLKHRGPGTRARILGRFSTTCTRVLGGATLSSTATRSPCSSAPSNFGRCPTNTACCSTDPPAPGDPSSSESTPSGLGSPGAPSRTSVTERS